MVRTKTKNFVSGFWASHNNCLIFFNYPPSSGISSCVRICWQGDVPPHLAQPCCVALGQCSRVGSWFGLLFIFTCWSRQYGFNLEMRYHRNQKWRDSNPSQPGKKPPLCHLSHRTSIIVLLVQLEFNFFEMVRSKTVIPCSYMITALL